MSLLNATTPVILTFNEAPNLERTLSGLSWAADIVVVDSGSTDGTLDILARQKNVRVFHRPFDTNGAQWRYAVFETGISTEWVLRLDADYQVPPEFPAEISAIPADAPYDAYEVAFDYAIFGRRLRSSLYPPNTILFRRNAIHVFQKGHTEGWSVAGAVGKLASRVTHDDWKPMSGWVGSQARYMAQELPHVHANPDSLKNRLRRIPPLMPIAAFLYCLFGRGLILDGRAGLFYALQRLLAETTLALMVLEERLARGDGAGDRNGR